MFVKYSLEFIALPLIYLAGWIILIHQCFCTAITCPPPDFPKDGTYKPMKLEYEVGSEVYYFCGPRFLLKGESTTTCQTNGRWSEESPFCDVSTQIINIMASSRVDSSESAAIDGDEDTCFRTRNGTEEFMRVYLGQKATVHLVSICYLEGTPDIFQITLYEREFGSPSGGRKCYLEASTEEVIGHCRWTNYICRNKIAEYITVHVKDTSSVDPITSLSICEIEVFTIDGEWCDDAPENFGSKVQLEIARKQALLTCKEGFKERENRRIYATCEGDKWSYTGLQCIEILCDSAVTSISDSEGKWESVGASKKMSIGTTVSLKCRDGYHLEGEPFTVTCLKNGSWTRTSATCKINEPPKEYKRVAISMGVLIVVIILALLGLKIYLIKRKKTKDPVVANNAGENIRSSSPPLNCSHSSSGLSERDFSTITYDEIKSCQCVPTAPPFELPDLPPGSDKDYMRTVDYCPTCNNATN